MYAPDDLHVVDPSLRRVLELFLAQVRTPSADESERHREHLLGVEIQHVYLVG